MAKDNVELNRIKAIATIETSKMLEIDDTDDVKEFLAARAVNRDSNDAPPQYKLEKSTKKLGAVCLSAGPLPEEVRACESRKNEPFSFNRLIPFALASLVPCLLHPSIRCCRRQMSLSVSRRSSTLLSDSSRS